MKHLSRWLLVNCLVLVPVVTLAQQDWPPIPEPGPIDEQTMASLRAGSVIVEGIRVDESGGAARVRALFKAPPEAIWRVVVSCEANFRFVQGLRECRVIEADERYARTRQVVKRYWFTPSMEYTFEAVRKPYSNMMFRLVEGDLKKMEGSWLFMSLEGGDTLVTHEIQVQSGLPSPRWLVRRSMMKDMPDMMACLRSLANASGSGAQQADDRARCPRNVKKD